MEDDSLANTLKIHRGRLDKVHGIVAQTKDLEIEIRQSLGEDISTQLITSNEEQSIRHVLEQKAVIAVIGERNSGKSSLINEILHHNVVPTSEMTCTSRVVRLKYSTDPYLCLLNVDGSEIPGSRKPLKGSKEDECKDRKKVRCLAALKGDDRENEDLVSQSVEVGLNHPLLQLGIEFVDSPGRNENKTLDVVVDRLVLERTAPIIIYVIDGNMCLRPSDRASIQFFKERCPGTKLFYICSKVDRDMTAWQLNDDSDESGEEIEEPPPSPKDLNKQERVLDELRFHCLLDEHTSLDRFHGISVKGMRAERKKGNVDNTFVEDFQKFRKKLASCLDAHLKTTLSSTIGSLMRCHGRCFYCFSQKQEQLEQEEEELAKVLKSARQSEEELYVELLRSVNSNKGKVQAIVTAVVHDVTADIGYEASHLKVERVAAYDHLLEHQDVQTKYPTDLPRDDQFYRLHALCNEIRNHIINTVFRRVERDVETLLEEEVAPLMWPKVIDTMEALDNETLKRDIESIYQFVGFDTDYREDTRKSLTDLMYALVRAVREDLNDELRRTYAILPMVDMAYGLYYQGNQQIPPMEDVAQTVVARLHSDSLADVIINACTNKMYANHEQFDKSIKHIEFFKQEMRINVKEQVGATTSMIISKLAQLEIQNHALKFDIIRGSLRKGEELFHGKHSRIYQYRTGWGLRNPKLFLVSVVKKRDEETWKRSIATLYYAFNCKRSPYLLGIHGWLLPTPDTLYIIMEKAATSLNKVKLETTQEKLKCVIDVATGIDCIHSSGFIFNNLEDKNILIMSDRRAVINTCKGRYEVLRGQAANIDIRQIGKLLLRLYGGNTSTAVTASARMNRPSSCGDDRVWRLIQRCSNIQVQITVKAIIYELQTMLQSLERSRSTKV
ncbi:dual serine/threonine and tyrosine protein kinase-like [Glandiceps talaboti]